MSNFEEYRAASHEISDKTIDIVATDAATGGEITFSAIRPFENDGEESYISQIRLWDPVTNEHVSDEVLMPDKLHIFGANTLKKIVRNKGKIAVAGTIIVTLAAGTGLLVRRFKHKT